ncbi:MAG: ATP-binding protein, partial [Polyangiaceae bacterium]
ETAETREGFLRAMPLLGRAESVAALGEALERLAAGTGSAFFVEGESGVGKSRLLEQLRRAAVGRGVCVLEGRGEASAQGPYRVFRLPLLRLALGPALRRSTTSSWRRSRLIRAAGCAWGAR